MSGSDWLTSAKVGDDVIVRGDYGVGRSISRIERLTKTQIIVAGSTTRFRRADGHEIGAVAYSGRALEQGTPEAVLTVRNAIRAEKLATQLNHRNWRNTPLETLEKVTALLTESAAEKPDV